LNLPRFRLVDSGSIIRALAGRESESMVRTKLLLLAAAALLATQGCVIYDEDADVRVHWQFSGFGSCAQADVAEIFIQVDGPDDFFESGFLPCELGFYDLPTDFEKGDVTVTVLGFPFDPNAGASWGAERPVDLHGGFNEFTFVLVPTF
jgi:hypothetical protein